MHSAVLSLVEEVVILEVSHLFHHLWKNHLLVRMPSSHKGVKGVWEANQVHVLSYNDEHISDCHCRVLGFPTFLGILFCFKQALAEVLHQGRSLNQNVEWHTLRGWLRLLRHCSPFVIQGFPIFF